MALLTRLNLAQALELAATTSIRARQATQTNRDLANAGPVPRRRLIQFMGNLSKAAEALTSVAATPGILEYAKNQYANQAYDIVAESTAAASALSSLHSWISTNFPKTGQAWLVNTYNADGDETPLTFTQAQLVPFVAECDAVLAVIE